MGREILVVKRDVLLGADSFTGFLLLGNVDFLSRIQKHFEYRERTDALEHDNAWQQPIPYVWLLKPSTRQVFLYKRAVIGGEARLHNRYSGGIGGHIDKDTEETSMNPLQDAMMRELHEELTLAHYPTPTIIGFLKYHSGVEDVHFGIVAVAETEETPFPADGMAEGKFYTVQEVETLLADPGAQFDLWTKGSWDVIKQRLLSMS
jgi:predicted NUDIX family phosphoesterase